MDLYIMNTNVFSSLRNALAVSLLSMALCSSANAGLSEGVAAYNASNYSAAVAQLKPLASQGNPIAQTYLAAMYDYGRGLLRDHKKSLMWFLLAAEQGYDKAQYALGVKYAKGFGVTKNIGESLKWFRQSADNGNKAAEERLLEMTGEIHLKAPDNERVQLENFSGNEGEEFTY